MKLTLETLSCHNRLLRRHLQIPHNNNDMVLWLSFSSNKSYTCVIPVMCVLATGNKHNLKAKGGGGDYLL